MFDCTRERRAPGFTGNFSKKSNPPGFRWLTLKLKSFSKVSADSRKTTLTFQLDPCGSAHSQEQLSRKPLHTRTKATNSNTAKIESFRLHVPSCSMICSMLILRSNPFISLPYNLQLLLCCESFLNSSVCQLPISTFWGLLLGFLPGEAAKYRPVPHGNPAPRPWRRKLRLKGTKPRFSAQHWIGLQLRMSRACLKFYMYVACTFFVCVCFLRNVWKYSSPRTRIARMTRSHA